MIIIADAHIDESRGNESAFFQMLDTIEETDQDVVFLGDIFELWIALTRYEKGFHKSFLAWCETQKQRRTVGFIEGNHEYFVAAQRKNSFSWCTERAGWPDANGLLFCHGDQINRRDRNYLRFRKIAKNQICQTVVRFLPFGPGIAKLLVFLFKRTNLKFRKRLPKKSIASFAEASFEDGIHTIFVGHFHRNYQYRESESKALYIVPGWLEAEQITLYDKESGRVSSCHWSELQHLSNQNQTSKKTEQ